MHVKLSGTAIKTPSVGQCLECTSGLSMKDSVDPLGRPTVSAGSDLYFHTCCPSLHPFCYLKYLKTKQISSENSYRYWLDCGSGRGDH